MTLGRWPGLINRDCVALGMHHTCGVEQLVDLYDSTPLHFFREKTSECVSLIIFSHVESMVET